VSLKRRVERLERRPHVTEADALPLDFWWVVSGILPAEVLDPETRRLVERLFNPPPAGPDAIEERLRQEEEAVRAY
jgi:hypothetical protein